MTLTALLSQFKPAAKRRTHLLLAATLWTVVGTVLLLVGVRWTFRADAGLAAALIATAVLAGALKYRFVLRRTALKNVDRILAHGDGRCLGGFLSWKTWILVAVMSGSGRLLRGTDLPREWIGPLYAAIGVALALGAWTLWQAWYRLDS